MSNPGPKQTGRLVKLGKSDSGVFQLQLGGARQIAIEVIDADTRQPVEGVAFELSGPAGFAPQQIVTDATGVARAAQLPQGTFTARSLVASNATPASAYSTNALPPPPARPSPAPLTVQRYLQLVRKLELAQPDWTGERVLNALRRLSGGATPEEGGYDTLKFRVIYGGIQPGDPVPPTPVRDHPCPVRKSLAAVTVHAVTSADGTLSALAQAHGLDWKTVARFNWGTADPHLVNLYLGGYVGCTQVDPSGRYVFDDADAPGLIYLPLPWEQTEIEPNQDTIKLEVHACPMRGSHLLSASEIQELTEMVKHEVTAGVETGVAQDLAGRQVALGHVLTGVSAGQHRLIDFDFAGAMASARGSNLEAFGAFFGVGANIDNLFAVTIAGDLGQTAVRVYQTRNKLLNAEQFKGWVPAACSSSFGPGSEATHAEAIGDIDGMILGMRLRSYLGKFSLDRSAKPGSSGMLLSEFLARFYTDHRPWPINYKTRFKGFRLKILKGSTTKLTTEALNFAKNYGYGGRTPRGMAENANAEYDSDVQDSVTAFMTWLKAQ